MEETTTRAIATSKTSIELAKPPEIQNNEIHGISDEYSLDTKNRDKSQQIPEIDIKSIQNKTKIIYKIIRFAFIE